MFLVGRAAGRLRFRATRRHRLRKTGSPRTRRPNKQFLFDGLQRPRVGLERASLSGLGGGFGINRVEAQRSVALFEHASSFQVAVFLVERLFAAVLCDNNRARRKSSLSSPAQQFQRDRVLFRLFIWRIEKYYFVAFWIWVGWF